MLRPLIEIISLLPETDPVVRLVIGLDLDVIFPVESI